MPTITSRKKINPERIRLSTGKTLKQWSLILDKWGAPKKGHYETAKYLHEKHKVAEWWCQMVTVEYEYLKGLRKVVHSVPKDLQKELNNNAKAKKAFAALPPSHKKEYIKAVTEAKKPETRERRIKKTIQQLLIWKQKKK